MIISSSGAISSMGRAIDSSDLAFHLRGVFRSVGGLKASTAASWKPIADQNPPSGPQILTVPRRCQTLKRYRTGGEQKVTVQHVSVSEGGQAIVGNVTQGARETAPKKTAKPLPALAAAQETPLIFVGESERAPIPFPRSRKDEGKHQSNTGPMLSSLRCGAKTRSGKPCRSPAVFGKERCTHARMRAGIGRDPATRTRGSAKPSRSRASPTGPSTRRARRRTAAL